MSASFLRLENLAKESTYGLVSFFSMQESKEDYFTSKNNEVKESHPVQGSAWLIGGGVLLILLAAGLLAAYQFNVQGAYTLPKSFEWLVGAGSYTYGISGAVFLGGGALITIFSIKLHRALKQRKKEFKTIDTEKNNYTSIKESILALFGDNFSHEYDSGVNEVKSNDYQIKLRRWKTYAVHPCKHNTYVVIIRNHEGNLRCTSKLDSKTKRDNLVRFLRNEDYRTPDETSVEKVEDPFENY